MKEGDLIATIALLISLNCDEDRLEEMLEFLSGKPIPDNVTDIIKEVRMAMRAIEEKAEEME